MGTKVRSIGEQAVIGWSRQAKPNEGSVNFRWFYIGVY